MKFARLVFALSGVYGLGVLVPMYFEQSKFERLAPPVVTHPELYYGFVGVGVAWQLAFLVIAVQPARYRLMMIPSMVEKFSYAAAVLVLGFQSRVSSMMLAFGTVDLVLGVLFVVAYLRVIPERDSARA